MLLLSNVLIMLFGLAVMTVGFWALIHQRPYFTIAYSDTPFNRVPVSMVTVGIMVTLLALLGILGGVFSRKLFGQILLGCYVFVLALMIVSEVGTGTAAVKFRGKVVPTLISNANLSLKQYNANGSNTTAVWDHAQKSWECCGSANYTSYHLPFGALNNTVPASCCNLTAVQTEEHCNEIRMNVTSETPQYFIYSQGCPAAIADTLRKNLLLIAATVIAIGVTQVLGIVVACIALYKNTREEKRGIAYEKLRNRY